MLGNWVGIEQEIGDRYIRKILVRTVTKNDQT